MNLFKRVQLGLAKELHSKTRKNNKNTFQDTSEENQEMSNEDKEILGATGGLAIFIIILIIFLFIGIVYVLVKSFILALKCNYGENEDKKVIELCLLVVGLCVCPIINVIYVFWKPTDCIKKEDVRGRRTVQGNRKSTKKR